MNYKKLLPIIGLIIFFCILTTLNFGKILEVFSTINIGYLLLALCSIIPILVLVTIEWQLILKAHKIKVSSLFTLKNIFIGYFYGFITPGGFGAYVRAFYLQQECGAPLQKCVVNIMLYNTVDYLALLSIGLVAGFLLGSIVPSLFPMLIFLFVVVICATYLLTRKNTGKRFFRRLLQARILGTMKDKWIAHIDTIYDELPSWRSMTAPFTVSLISWVVWFVELYFIAQLFSIQVPFLSFFVVVVIATIVAAIPISIYGFGTRDATLIGLFSLFGVASENVVSFSLFWFTIAWLIPSVIGVGVTLLESKRLKPIPKP